MIRQKSPSKLPSMSIDVPYARSSSEPRLRCTVRERPIVQSPSRRLITNTVTPLYLLCHTTRAAVQERVRSQGARGGRSY